MDRRDAQDIVLVLSALRRIGDEVDPGNKGTFKTALRPRGFLEGAWERRRRRGKNLSKKFAFGSLWSKDAHQLTFDGRVVRPEESWLNKLMLEHVVPAEAVIQVIQAMISADATLDRIEDALYGLFHHVVITRVENKLLPPTMTNEDVSLLIGHHTGGNTMTPDEYETLIWKRYSRQMIHEFRVPIRTVAKLPDPM